MAVFPAPRSEYQLDVKQQPKQARMAGTGEKADRRPLDPPPIIQLRIRRPRPKGAPAVALTDDDFISPTLTHSLFCFASLIAEDNEDEMYLLDGSRTKHVTGSVVSSLFHLKDQSCFVFPDLSVRTEGRWRFKMSMYEIVEYVLGTRGNSWEKEFGIGASADVFCWCAATAFTTARRSSRTPSPSTRANGSLAWLVRLILRILALDVSN